MGLLQDLGVAPGTVKADDVEKNMASGGLPPEGVHHAVLEGAEGPSEGRNGHKLTFKIIAGPGEGTTVEDVLWRPKGADAKKDKAIVNRTLVFGSRLGLLKRDRDGNLAEVEGKYGFGDCLGAACFIEIRHEEEEYQPKDKDGRPHGGLKKIKKAKLTFEGVLSPDDKKCKDVPKGNAAALPIGKPAGPPKDTLDDL